MKVFFLEKKTKSSVSRVVSEMNFKQNKKKLQNIQKIADVRN